MYELDLNSDIGESYGTYTLGNDGAVLNLVTSANIACGFHAGDAPTMRKTVTLALEKGVALGAHPGLPDLAGFGRRNMDITAQEAYDMVVYQIGALDAFVRALGATMQHVKPHGALYNMAAVRANLAEAIAQAVHQVNPELVLYGLSGSQLIRAGNKIGLRTASEVFADRTYQQDGTLTPRTHPRALIHEPEEAAKQVVRMVKEGRVLSQQGTDVEIQADTVCIHGDGPHAVELARYLKPALIEAGIQIAAFQGRQTRVP